MYVNRVEKAEMELLVETDKCLRDTLYVSWASNQTVPRTKDLVSRKTGDLFVMSLWCDSGTGLRGSRSRRQQSPIERIVMAIGLLVYPLVESEKIH